MPQIRLSRTPEINHVLSFLRGKYPLMSEAEIIKLVLSEKYREEVEESGEEEKQVRSVHNHLMAEGKKLGSKLIVKKGLKRKKVSEQQFYDLFLNNHKHSP